MKWVLIVLALQTAPQTAPQTAARAAPRVAPVDPWVGIDKWKHFAACAVIESVTYGFASSRNRHGASLRIGMSAVAVIGLTRELSDKRRKGHFSVRDLTWDLLGGVAAVAALHAVR